MRKDWKKRNETRLMRRVISILLVAAILIVSRPPCVAEAATTVTVTLMNKSGTKVLQKLQVKAGKYVTLPANKDTSGTVFMGWSTAKNLKKNPQYLPAQKIKIKKNLTLYEVRFKRSADIMPSESSIPAIDTSKYAKVFFVGDSRMAHTNSAIKRYYSDSFLKDKHIAFVSKSGTGLNYFLSNTTGNGTYAQLRQKLEAAGAEKRKAVVFCFGVNDLRQGGNVTETKMAYVFFLRQFRKELQTKYNCDLYFMSVNPVNQNTTRRYEADIRTFNEYLKASGVYRGYIDTYSWMYANGFNFWHYTHNCDDGVHFSQATCMRVLKYAIQYVNAAG